MHICVAPCVVDCQLVVLFSQYDFWTFVFPHLTELAEEDLRPTCQRLAEQYLEKQREQAK